MKHKGITVIMTAGAIGLGVFVWTQRAEPTLGPSFQAVRVERGTIEVTTLATGIVQPQNRLEVKPPIAGRVERILVDEGDRVARGQVLAWLSSLERAALLDAARSKGAAELAHWEDLYKPAPLLAPIAGMVIARNVEPGQSTSADIPLFVLSDRLIVKAQVDETDIGRIKIGQAATLSLDAYADSETAARVDHIAYEALTVNNVTVYEVDVVPSAVPAFMRSGMTANVTFQVAKRENVLVVPAEAIEERMGIRTARIAAGKGPEARTAIEAGLSDGDRVEVLSGLDEGATVLVPVLEMPKAAGAQGTSPFVPTRGGSRGSRGGSRGSR